MKNQFTFEDEEWQLVIELLEKEQGDLPAEIHHTDTTEYRERLLKRQETVNHLLAALRRK